MELKMKKPLSFYAMNLLIIILVLVPKDFGTIFTVIPIRLVAMVLMALFFLWDYYKGKIKLNDLNIKWYVIAYALFLLLTIPSFINTKSMVISIYTFLKFVMLGVVFFIFTMTSLDKQDYLTLLKTLLIVSSIVAIMSIVQYIFSINLNLMGIDKYDIKGRVSTTFFNPIYFGTFINIVYFYCIYAFRQKMTKNFWILILAVSLAAGLILTFTRSAILIFTATLIANIVTNFKMIWNRYVIITIIVSIGLIFLIPGAFGVTKNAFQYGSQMATNKEYMQEFTLNLPKEEDTLQPMEAETEETSDPSDTSDPPDINVDASLVHRADFAKIGNQIAADNPYTGIGFGTYIDYMSSKDFKNTYSSYTGSLTHPHSFFILLSAETGYLATIVYALTLLIILLMLTITWIKSLKEKNHVYSLNTIVIIMFVGFICTAYIAENLFYDTQISTLFYIIVGLTMNYIKNSGYSLSLKGGINEKKNQC